MIKPLDNKAAILVGLVIVGLLGAGAYYAFDFIKGLFDRLDPQVAAITTIAAATVLISASIIASAIRSLNRWNNAYALTIKKRVTYERLIQIWREALWQGADRDDMDTNDLRKLEQQLLLWGNPPVIQAYAALRQFKKEGGLLSPEIPEYVIDVLMEMRKDLGLNTLELDEDDLFELIADADQGKTKSN
jgi:hypothetical protein